VEKVQAAGFALRESISTAERLEHVLHPWTSYVIVPFFALANAGIALSASSLRDAASSPITLGVVIGFVAGKLVCISTFTWLAVRVGVGRLPEELTHRHVFGMAALAGIGFTVSIFVAGLAYTTATMGAQAKIGVIAASIGSGLLLTAPGHTGSHPMPMKEGSEAATPLTPELRLPHPPT
jgi:NhaA family Na+:H+ antiporter